MQEQLSVLRVKNEKMLANWHHKKSLLDEATIEKYPDEEMQIKETDLHTSIASLTDGLENVTASPDGFRTKASH